MLYHICIMIFSVDLGRYGISRNKDLDICGLWYNICEKSEHCPEIMHLNMVGNDKRHKGLQNKLLLF